MIEQPWYPPWWLDADGKPLPDVYEVSPGEWPPCRPHDWIEPLTKRERESGEYPMHQSPAASADWGSINSPYTIVAIRITLHERCDPIFTRGRVKA